MKVRALLPLLAILVTLAACSSSPPASETGSTTTAAAGADCPVDPVATTVSVDQWGDIVTALGGACAEVTTVLRGSAVDPHDFEPAPGDIAAFTDARLVVINGADYDHWAEQAVDTLPSRPTVVSAAEANGIEEGANPHLWYGPDFVQGTADAVTAAFQQLAPEGADYFDQQKAAWQESMEPYFAEVARIKASAAGTTFGATESVFDYMAEALGLVDATPPGFRNAAAAGSEPAPGDVFAFDQALTDGTMRVLIFNAQTEGSVPAQLRTTAQDAGVPIVSVTETVAPGADGFVAWQVGQLQQLASALDVS